MDPAEQEKKEKEQEEKPAAQDELNLLQDRYLRVLAEFENFKKRSERERQIGIRFANERLIEELLPVLDHLEQAVAVTNGASADSVVVGVKMVLKQFQDILERHGVVSVVPQEGTPFDPSKHEALEQRESDVVLAGHVISVMQKGYVLHDRLVRPARVIVSKGI